MKLTSDTFTPDELCAIVQSLRIAVCQRLYWMMTPLHPIRGGPLEEEVEVFSHMVNAYSKAMWVAREDPMVAQSFKDYFMISDDVYKAIDEVEAATTWDEVPTHKHSSILSCKLCEELITAV